ncbi:hypothetical protein STEG23_012512, partial [Scotinomys teguina]
MENRVLDMLDFRPGAYIFMMKVNLKTQYTAQSFRKHVFDCNSVLHFPQSSPPSPSFSQLEAGKGKATPFNLIYDIVVGWQKIAPIVNGTTTNSGFVGVDTTLLEEVCHFGGLQLMVESVV